MAFKRNIDQQFSLIPVELWVDVFKFLSRRNLAHRVQPASKRFCAIVERHVDNLHVIRHFGRFLRRLEHNLPKAHSQLEQLETEGLASYFRLGGNIHFYMSTEKSRRQIQLRVLRNCPKLFQHCICHLAYLGGEPKEWIANLDQLHTIRPFCIKFERNLGTGPSDDMLRQPSVLTCLRVHFSQWWWGNETNPEAIPWLHHSAYEKTTRILHFTIKSCQLPEYIVVVVEHCKQILQNAKTVADRTPFLFIFSIGFDRHQTSQIQLFRNENALSGEVLQLERRELGTRAILYRLRRCSVADLATTDQFYRDNFHDNDDWSFRAPEEELTLTFR